MPRPSAVTRLAALALLALLAGSLAACDAQADLVDHFGFEPPPPGAAPTPTPSPSPTPTATPTPSPTPAPTPSPTPLPAPTGTPGRTPSVPASPTRPPNLPAFSVLRERATAVAPDRIAAQPARYEDTLLFFEGRVLDVADEGGGQFRARIRAGGGIIHLVYDEATYWGQPLVEGDRIRVVGYLEGLSVGERLPVIEIHDLVVRFT